MILDGRLQVSIAEEELDGNRLRRERRIAAGVLVGEHGGRGKELLNQVRIRGIDPGQILFEEDPVQLGDIHRLIASVGGDPAHGQADQEHKGKYAGDRRQQPGAPDDRADISHD